MHESDQTVPGERCLVIMAKYPAPGQVKTRLAADVGDEHSCELYRCFLRDLLANLSVGAWSLRLALYPWEKHEAMTSLIGGQTPLMPQRGDDLGARMDIAFRDLFLEGHLHVVMIGSDAPDLSPEFIAEAFEALADHDAVLGPTSDGGYYLIGFRRDSFQKELFSDVHWSKPETCSEQLKRFREKGLRTYILPTWRDVDTLADLKNLVALGTMTPLSASQTMAYIRVSGLVPVA
jgi:rSAM/selenodomain-associated transferase 1